MIIRYAEIRKMCDDLGITVSELERECGFAKGSLCKIDKHKPRKDKMDKLETVFKDYLNKRQTSINKIGYNMASIDKVTNLFAGIGNLDLSAVDKYKEDKEFNRLVEGLDMVTEPYRQKHFEEELKEQFSIEDIERILANSDAAIVRRINKFTDYLLSKADEKGVN